MGKIQDCKIVREIKSTIAWVLKEFKNNKAACLVLIVGAMFALLAPWALTRSAWFDWAVFATDSKSLGQIGDVIGGTTAPILNFMASILVFLAFRSQIQANKDVQNQFAEDQKERLLKFYSDLFDEWITQINNFKCKKFDSKRNRFDSIGFDAVIMILKPLPTYSFDVNDVVIHPYKYDIFNLYHAEVVMSSGEQWFIDFEQNLKKNKLNRSHAKMYFQMKVKYWILQFKRLNDNACENAIERRSVPNPSTPELKVVGEISKSYFTIIELLEKIESEFK